MLGQGATGAANEMAVARRIAIVERRLPSLGRSHLPPWWPLVEVRRYLIGQHGFVTLDMARAHLVAQLGSKRAPSRSAIHRFWQRLDKLELDR
jgi:hypothetical protein